MRGQDSEKQVPREGKSKAEDENQQASGHAGASSSHQIRSRITVVCGECKRLKLKCDRRNPCGSCTKRDTVARCIYSTAAAEKVDLHSLNNRLMQVESILAMVTAGQTPPPFQSSYPLAQVAVPSPSSSTRTRQARPKAPLMSPLSILLEDLKNIWLSHTLSGLDGDDESTTNNGVKLEPTGMDSLLRLTDSDLDPTDDPPRGFKPPTGIKLPPHHAYYSQSGHTTAGFPVRSIPVTSETLFAFLPAALDRAKHICCAVNADPSLTMLTNWEAISQAAQFTANSLSGSSAISSRLSGPTRNVDAATTPRNEGVSVPIFAALIYVVAIGSLEGSDVQEGFSSPAHLDELGSQALQVYSEYFLDENIPRGEHGADCVAFLSAMVLQLKFRFMNLRSKSMGSAVPPDSLQSLFPLIGQLVNLGRSLGFAQEPHEVNDDHSQARKLIWWEISFYDAFISDALGQPSLILPASYTTELPDLKIFGSSSERESNIDGLPSDDEVISTTVVKSKASSNTFEYHCLCGLHGQKIDGALSRLEYRGKAALFAQCRLTQFLQLLRHSLAHDNCECCMSHHGSGYTLDQAAQVEASVREVMNDLPSVLKLHPPPRIDQSREPWMAVIAGKMSILANRIIIAAYVPLMRPPLDEKTGELSKARTYAAQPWSSPNRTTLEASQNVLAAVELLQRFKDFDKLTQLLVFHPVGKGVFDATIICACTGLSNGVGYSASMVKVACDDMLKGLNLLPTLGRLSADMAQVIASIRQSVPNLPSSPIRDDVVTQNPPQPLKRKRSHPSSPAHSSDHQLSPPNAPSAVPSSSATSSTPGGTDNEPPPTSLQRTITEIPTDTEGSKTDKYPPPVGVRNRGKGGPSWAKKLSPRQPTGTYSERPLPPDSLDISIPSRPVSSRSGTLDPVISPHSSDSYLRMLPQSTMNSTPLPSNPSSHPYRSNSAHPQNESELDERYRQRRRLSYDETAASNAAASFDQRSNFGTSFPGASPSYFSVQGSIQGNIQISPRSNPEPMFNGQTPASSSLSRTAVDERSYRMQQPESSFASHRDPHFDGTLSITAVLSPTGEAIDKTLGPIDEPVLYPGYAVQDPKLYDGNPTQGDGMSMMPVDPTTFTSPTQSANTQWGASFSPSFPLDDRPPQTQYWNTDNYYQ